MKRPSQSERKTRELLAMRALEGLSSAAEAELAGLLGPGQEMPDDYELAAAALHLVFAGSPLPMPLSLHERLVRLARQRESGE